ncbi:hypothetical protein D3C78_1480930 [compost metagenome]
MPLVLAASTIALDNGTSTVGAVIVPRFNVSVRAVPSLPAALAAAARLAKALIVSVSTNFTVALPSTTCTSLDTS